MMASIKSKKDDITPVLNAVGKALKSQQGITFVCAAAKAVIADRARSGQGVNGAFAPYRTKPYYAPITKRPPSYPAPQGGRHRRLTGRKLKMKTMYYPSYAEYKSKMGRGSNPNLTMTGAMLNAIVWNVESNRRAYLFFASQLEANKAHGLHTTFYPFFALRDSDKTSMTDSFIEGMRRSQKLAAKYLKKGK
jgi:hypothetical protein